MQLTSGLLTGTRIRRSRALTTARASAVVVVVTALGSGCAALPYAAKSPPPATSATLPAGARWTEVAAVHVRFAVPADAQDTRGTVPDAAFDQTQEMLGADDSLMNEVSDDDNYALLLGGQDAAGPWTLNARVITDTGVPSDKGLTEAFADLNTSEVSVQHVATPIGTATVVRYRSGPSHVGESLFLDRGRDVLNISYGASTPAAVNALDTTVVGSLHVTG